MCVDLSPPAPPSAVLHDIEMADPIMLDPVDSVEIVSLMDNVTDVFMPDQGPARRADFVVGARRDCGVMAGGTVPDALVAEHGFSMLITVRKGDRTHRILFDTGISPDGVVANMRRLDIDPGSIEAIICSHGHFDHTTGLDGLARALGARNMPVLIPTVSRRGLEEIGFQIIENRQPSFLLDGSVLVTGEVPRVICYVTGFPP